MTIGQSRDSHVVGDPQNTAQGGQGGQGEQGGQGGQGDQGGPGNPGGWGGQERLGWGGQYRESSVADSSFPQQDFRNVLAPAEGGRRGFSARGPGAGLARGALGALGGRQRQRTWSSGTPPPELMAILQEYNRKG